jgi:hypothetical protein
MPLALHPVVINDAAFAHGASTWAARLPTPAVVEVSAASVHLVSGDGVFADLRLDGDEGGAVAVRNAFWGPLHAKRWRGARCERKRTHRQRWRTHPPTHPAILHRRGVTSVHIIDTKHVA